MDKKQLKELAKLLEKCLRPKEEPFKWKHANGIILKTRELQTSEVIWSHSAVRNLTLNPFVTWKFCCLLHRILNEGPSNALRGALKYIEKLKQCNLYWNLSTQHMSQCIVSYLTVLIKKLVFHLQYTNFMSNFQINEIPLEDINICFQLCLDLFDYLESLLHLQSVIFVDMQRYKNSAASKKGLCHLSALFTIIAECNILYDHSVTILQLLHTQLSLDDISGLNNRFNVIFENLKLFYAFVRHQQFQLDYYLAIPYLPDTKPNFINISYKENQPEPSAPFICELE